MSPAGPPGEIITFYSYKGGTGRTMALANIAYLLARDAGSGDVLMVDWDLEAPGLHRYFRDLVQGHFQSDPVGAELDRWPGLIDLLLEANRLVGIEPGTQGTEGAKAVFERISLDRFVLKTDLESLYLLKAGRFDDSYPITVSTFDWEGLHARSPLLFRGFAEYLAERFRYVLIDSRTGITDSGGVCTCIMPDTLVVVFTPNRQSLLGSIDAARNAGVDTERTLMTCAR